MGIPVWQPYLSKHKRQRTHLGDFECESFELPHNGCPNVGYLIRADYLTIAYLTDMEYCKWDLRKKKINVALIEMNYQESIMDDLEVDSHIAHTVRGHMSDRTTTEFILHNKKHLQDVILCHYSQSGNINRDTALAELNSKLPKYINVRWAVPGEEVTLGCPF